MKIKTFLEKGQINLDEAVNDWLASNPDIEQVFPPKFGFEKYEDETSISFYFSMVIFYTEEVHPMAKAFRKASRSGRKEKEQGHE